MHITITNRYQTLIPWLAIEEKTRKKKMWISLFEMGKEACVTHSYSFKGERKQKSLTTNEKCLKPVQDFLRKNTRIKLPSAPSSKFKFRRLQYCLLYLCIKGSEIV